MDLATFPPACLPWDGTENASPGQDATVYGNENHFSGAKYNNNRIYSFQAGDQHQLQTYYLINKLQEELYKIKMKANFKKSM